MRGSHNDEDEEEVDKPEGEDEGEQEYEAPEEVSADKEEEAGNEKDQTKLEDGKSTDYGKAPRSRRVRPAPYGGGSGGRGRAAESSRTWNPPPSRVPSINPSLDYLPATAFTQYTKPLKVSSKSNVKKVAGSIAYTSRAGESPTLMGTGKESINQAIKALAIARDYLKDNKLDINAYPEFRSEEDEAISVVLTKTALRKSGPADEGAGAELRVAAGSQPTEVAGSIAGKIRHGDRVAISCLGAASVNQTIKSIIFARRYLANEAIDICFRPEWVHITMKGEERSSLRFVIYAQQI